MFKLKILPTPTPTKSNGANANDREESGPSTSRAAAAAASMGAVRHLRTNRNTVVEPPVDSDDDDDSDDEPLATSQGSQHRDQSNKDHTYTHNCNIFIPFLFIVGKVMAPHPTHLQRRDISKPATLSSHMTRSHATSTTSNVATSSNVAPPTVHDHNYIGDPGPSTSSAAIRNTRRVLSRHQRNADELDISLDPLESSMLISATTRLRRGMPTSTTTASAATTVYQRQVPPQQATVPVRRGRSRFSQENSQTEPSADEHVPEDEEEGVSDMGTGGSTESSGNDNGSDSDDNQPLTSYVPKSRRGRNAGRKRRHSDDSFVANEDDDDEYTGTGRQRSKNPKPTDERKGRPQGRRNQRGSRNQKRPRYNELSDDEEYANRNNRGRKSRNESDVVDSSAAHDEIDASTMDSDDDQLVSVSSRGRIRKITAKARGIFKE